MKWLTLFALALIAAVFGVVAGLFGGVTALILFVPVVPMLFVMRDFRVGVAFLAFALPWSTSPVLPQASGFNIVNYILAFTLLAFVAQVVVRRRFDLPPRYFVLLYVLPLTFGIILAVPHLREAASYARLSDAPQYETLQYVKARFLRPFGLVLFAVFLAHAVRNSKRPERWLVVMACSAVLPALAVFALIALYSVSLSALQEQRNFMGPLGYHANEMGLLLASAFGPLLFMMGAIRGMVARVACVVALAAVSVALVLTFSRGAMLAAAVMVAIYLWRSRRPAVLVGSLVLILTMMLAAPDAVRERIGTGVESGALSSAASRLDDPLTAGRGALWQRLVPDVQKSPIWGSGTGSTHWSSVASQRIANINHPHNVYLEMLLDLGLLGLFAICAAFFKHVKGLFAASSLTETSPVLSRYFAGAAAAWVGILVMGFTNGHYFPAAEQTFLWFSIGMLFAYWPQLVRATPPASGSHTVVRRGFGMASPPVIDGMKSTRPWRPEERG